MVWGDASSTDSKSSNGMQTLCWEDEEQLPLCETFESRSERDGTDHFLGVCGTEDNVMQQCRAVISLPFICQPRSEADGRHLRVFVPFLGFGPSCITNNQQNIKTAASQ